MLLRPGLLDGTTIALAGGADAAAAALRDLGGRTPALDGDLLDEAAVTAAAAALEPRPTALIADAAAAFAAAGGGLDGLRTGLDGTWNALRAVVNAALRPAGGGIAVLLAAPPGAGPHAAALRAALDNLARTTAIEWARHGVRVVAVLPGDATPAADAAQLCAYLVSPAGAYFTGCAFTLGEVAA